MSKNIFQKIIDREISASIIYEDKKHLAFLNAFPFDNGHSLLIPKKAYKTIWDMSENEFLELQKVLFYLVNKIREKTGKDIAIYQRNGVGSGQEIPHLHFHIVPRFSTEKEKPLFNDEGSKIISDENKDKFSNLFKF